MRTDPTIDRIRKIRHEISEECNHDTRKIIEYYMKYQQKYADRLMKKSIIPLRKNSNQRVERTAG
jgi:hypothetical protein